MTTVFIINAGIRLPQTNNSVLGTLSKHLVSTARNAFKDAGHNVIETDLNEAWTLEEELEKVLASNLILLQTPIWAMSTPWQYTKWQDEVLTHSKVCGTDGRTRTDPSKKYGTGGFLTDKKYWLSTTWNAPHSALYDPGNFFDARGIEEVLMPLHKQFAYMGIKCLQSTFAIFDVYKNPQIERDLKRFDQALKMAVQCLAA